MEKKKNPVFCEWKQALAFVHWVFICSATTVQIKMLISCVQMGTGTEAWSKCGSSAKQFTINATVPSGLPQERKTLTENVFSIV